jgi:hypothetical protein
MKTVEIGLHDFKNIALLIVDTARTDRSFQLREKFEFINDELGGHCQVIVTKVQGDRIYWDLHRLYYINPIYSSNL